MNLNDLTACFPSIKDWEDSYFTEPTNGQRLLGNANDYQVEIILETELRKVAFFFSNVNEEMVSCLNLFTGGRLKSIAFLRGSSAFVAHNPNIPCRKTFGDFEVTLTQIRDSEKTVSTLVIAPISGPSSLPQK